MRLRRTHFDELEADFQEYYSLDFSEVPQPRAARLLFQLPRRCRTFVALNPELQWDWPEVLANKTNYLLEMLAWQKTKDAQRKGRKNPPKLFVPDFMRKRGRKDHLKDTELHTVEDIKAILSKPRRSAEKED